jgi:cyclase
VKGVKFENIREIDDPLALARRYNDDGADELVLYDITASLEGRTLFEELLEKTANAISVPLAVGGGICSIEDFGRMIDLGASKVSINTGAIKDPGLIESASKKFGKERVVLAMDVKRVGDRFMVFTKGGMEQTDLDAANWAAYGENHGAGELVLNSIDADGSKCGYDIELLKMICALVRIPVIASGGAGSIEHFIELFRQVPDVGAGLAASVFHFGEVKIRELKQKLSESGIEVCL